MANRPQLPVAPPVLLTCGSIEDLQEKPSGTSVYVFLTTNPGKHDFTYNLQCEEMNLSFFYSPVSHSMSLLWYPPEGSYNWHGHLLRPHKSMFLRSCQSQQMLINHNIFKINMVDCKWIFWLLYLGSINFWACVNAAFVLWNVIFDCLFRIE